MPENSPNQPMVSIVVPVYKAERFFRRMHSQYCWPDLL